MSSGVKTDEVAGWKEAEGGLGCGCVAVVLLCAGEVGKGEARMLLVCRARTERGRAAARRVRMRIDMAGTLLTIAVGLEGTQKKLRW